MKKIIPKYLFRFFELKSLALYFLLFLAVTVSAQETTVLPWNGSFSPESAPQGGLRFQRSLYLISPAEMNAAEFSTGSVIQSIGFTIAAAQNDSTRGAFNVYLENTADMVSRLDLGWTTATTSANELWLDQLLEGDYECQVKAVCGTDSGFSGLLDFQTSDTLNCNRPGNLRALDVTSTGATLSWSAQYSTHFVEYEVEYGLANSNSYVSMTTMDTFLIISGLTENTSYQWRVTTSCTSDASAGISNAFKTEVPDNCEEPSGLSVTTVTDTSAVVGWTAASGAIYYEIEFRRLGSAAWSNGIAVATQTQLNGLIPGATYEWRVRTVCGAGKGAFVNSMDNVTTTGVAPCFTPQGLAAYVRNDTSAVLKWIAVPGATAYEVRYRLKNSISWANAIAPMVLVHSDSINLPDSIGAFSVPFSGTGISPFTYTGEGIYVAFEWSRSVGELRTNSFVLATTENTILQNVAGIDSAQVVLALVTRADTSDMAQRDILFSTSLRPETRFGSSSVKDSVEVVAVYTYGFSADPYGSPVPISALIKNHSAGAQDYTATLEVRDQATGALRHTDNQTVSIAGDTAIVVTFAPYSPSVNETDSVIVSVPALGDENVLANNSNHYLTKINSSIVAYADQSDQVASTGFGTGTGLILARYKMNGCGAVNAAQVYLDYSAIGDTMYAVVMNEAGAIIDSSAVFIAGEEDVNTYHSFYFPEVPLFVNETYYIGLAQIAHPGESYNPVGVQWETAFVRDSAYYRANIDGTNLTHMPEPGRLMIRSEVVPGGETPVINGDLTLCSGDLNTLSVASANTRYATSITAVSTQFADADYAALQVLGAPDIYPAYGSNTGQWLSSLPDEPREYIELGFSNPAPINFIDIYETLNPGSVDTVYVKNPGTGNFEMVYTATATEGPEVATRNHITFPLTAFDVSVVRIAMASDSVSGYNGIDAVGIGEEIPATFAAYSWSTGSSAATIDVSVAGTYAVTVTDGSGCISASSVVATSADQVTPTITVLEGASTTFCTGESIVLMASEASNIVWSTGATTSNIVVTGSGSYTVNFDDGTGCGINTSAPLVVTVNPLPVVNITGSLGICPSGSTMLDAGTGFAAYSWSTGATTQTIPVISPGGYSVTVVGVNGCEGSGSVTTYQATPPNPNISGDTGFCPGGNATLNAGAGYASYSWSAGGATGQTLTVNTANTYSVTVSDNNGCTGSDSQVITAFVPPTPPIISGGLTFCDGNTTVLDAGANLASYLWSTGATTNAIVVNSAGTFSVTVTDVNGCTGSDQVMTSLEGALPETPGPISGPSMGLCGATGLVYSIDIVPNTTHYVWTVPNGMTIVSGQGSTSITVDAIPNFTSGIIVAKASNTCGQSPTYNQQYLLVQGYPDLPGTPQGPAAISCLSVHFYSVDPVSGADSYNWSVPAGATILSGQGTNTILVKFFNFSGSGEVCVDALNGCGVSICCMDNCLTVTCTNEVIDFAETGGLSDETSVEATKIIKGTPNLFETLGVYPNPNNGRFRLEGMVDAEGDMEILVYSLLGELVHRERKGFVSKGMIKQTVVSPNLSEGTYLLKVKIGSETWNSKIIIMN